MYLIELQLNKANSTGTEAPCLICIYYYDKRDGFDVDIINFPSGTVTLLIAHLIVFTFFNFNFDLQECQVIWLTSVLVTKL